MDYRQIKRLATAGENITVEFKRKIAHPEKVVKEIVAFANTNGGILLIGVDDDGTIPGLKSPEGDIFVLNEAIQKYCKPKIGFRQGTIAITEKKSVVYYEIPSSNKKPHYVIENFKTKWGSAFVRVEDRSIKASKEVREIIKRSRRLKDIKFNYGEKEKALMSYLEANGTITLKKYMEVANISQWLASKTLILLTLANVLRISPNEGGDIYSLKI